ncbi:outer dense fiber protein 3-like protein 2a isoform X1 [Salvelinus alpinus]|uniref:outer dense fiber protein 3-like protein 2a isoform X1 n=1 Tax=Salvelinus alpinus TaxID=8036 RepID=UPI0039FDC775
MEVKRRPIIAGREKGPGPGRYALPPTIGYINHDLTKPSSPAYTFHRRMSSSMVSVDCSPGPQYHIDAKMTRFGRVGTPSYSMLGRARRAADLFQTPGPGAYSPEKPHLRPPSYTIGSRSRYRIMDSVPAPNRYTLPNLLGSQVPHKPSSASYSLAGRRQVGAPSEDLSMTPGPGRYNSTDPSVYLTRQPSFSMQVYSFILYLCRYLLYLFIYFAPLHPIISVSTLRFLPLQTNHSSVFSFYFTCCVVFTSPPWPFFIFLFIYTYICLPSPPLSHLTCSHCI